MKAKRVTLGIDIPYENSILADDPEEPALSGNFLVNQNLAPVPTIGHTMLFITEGSFWSQSHGAATPLDSPTLSRPLFSQSTASGHLAVTEITSATDSILRTTGLGHAGTHFCPNQNQVPDSIVLSTTSGWPDLQQRHPTPFELGNRSTLPQVTQELGDGQVFEFVGLKRCS